MSPPTDDGPSTDGPVSPTMEPLRHLVDRVREIRGVYQVGALAMVTAVPVAFVAPPVSLGIIGLGALSFGYGLLAKRSSDEDAVVINPARGKLYAVADEHLAQDRPDALPELDWIIYRHLKADRPELGLGKAGQIPARLFVDLREASLVPSQCECLATALSTHIRNTINVENHHGLIIPKSGNAILGMAVARELGLAPIIVRDWPFYGRWIETLITSGRAIVVDDVSTEGELLVEAAERAREAGFVVSRAFLVIKRGEGNAESILDGHRLSLSAVYTLTDVELEEMVAEVRRL